MSTIENNITQAIEYPEYTWEYLAAAKDPLTPEPVLRRIYEEQGDDVRAMEALASNPALPSDMLHSILKSSSSYLTVRNPNISLDEIKQVVCAHFEIKISALANFSTILEIFDWLIHRPIYAQPFALWFVSALLRASEATAEEYSERVIKFSDRLTKHGVLKDGRFDPSSVIFPAEYYVIRSITANPSTTPELLLRLTKTTPTGHVLDTAPLDNLNYPIQLSAQYHLSNLDDYRWSPTYLIDLEVKADEYIVKNMDEGPWENLPLAWKLKMIAT